MPELFDSRNLAYRTPFGAVREKTEVLFRICIPRTLHCTAAVLHMIPDGEMDNGFGMFWAGMEGEDYEWWDCRYTPLQPGLFWYWFELKTGVGEFRLARQADSRAFLKPVGEEGDPWQLTCYASHLQTPGWLAGGIMYQIFPDRFAASGLPKKGVPEDRLLRKDWGGQPEWRPDEQGVVRNNDYFGGDLAGIENRLDRLKELGVTALYLNPIFEAHSNHRYNTADYTRIDPLLGTSEDFRSLAETARRLGIRLILDGVFSHTGDDSWYFNREHRYPGVGAYESLSSPYAGWYSFIRWPEEYETWWGFLTLPQINKHHPDYRRFISGGQGIARRWLREGACGWRLDVADELPDGFLEEFRRAVKEEDPEALIVGEVWEDASNKESYGHRRRYLLGDQLDTVMNYPFREAVLRFLIGGSSYDLMNTVMDIEEHYPPGCLRLLMNSLSTHDTERALTVLGGEPAGRHGRDWQARQHLTAEQRRHAVQLMKLAVAIQYTLPGVPCIYYGDEAGMEGYRDPFNRGCYPWGQEDAELLRWHRRMGKLRRSCPVLKEGRFLPPISVPEVLCYERRIPGREDSVLLCGVNRSRGERTVLLPQRWRGATVSMGEGWIEETTLHLPPWECALAVLETGGEENG